MGQNTSTRVIQLSALSCGVGTTVSKGSPTAENIQCFTKIMKILPVYMRGGDNVESEGRNKSLLLYRYHKPTGGIRILTHNLMSYVVTISDSVTRLYLEGSDIPQAQ